MTPEEDLPSFTTRLPVLKKTLSHRISMLMNPWLKTTLFLRLLRLNFSGVGEGVLKLRRVGGGRLHCIIYKAQWKARFTLEPVWASGKALGWWAGSRVDSLLALFSRQKFVVCGHLWLYPTLSMKLENGSHWCPSYCTFFLVVQYVFRPNVPSRLTGC